MALVLLAIVLFVIVAVLVIAPKMAEATKLRDYKTKIANSIDSHIRSQVDGVMKPLRDRNGAIPYDAPKAHRIEKEFNDFRFAAVQREVVRLSLCRNRVREANTAASVDAIVHDFAAGNVKAWQDEIAVQEKRMEEVKLWVVPATRDEEVGYTRERLNFLDSRLAKARALTF